MEYREETLDKLELFIDNYLKEMKNKYKDNSAMQDKLNHIARVTILTEKICGEDRLARIAAKFHDIGRFPQLELLGSFNDGKVLHHYLGEDLVARALYKGELEPSKELDVIRLAISYHARMNTMPYKTEVPKQSLDIVDAVGRADDIENGCIGATGYLLREADEDAKGYKRDNPDLDMKAVSPEVWEFFEKGEKFDKMKHCKTYADYTLFASVLAIQALKGKDRLIAKAAMDLQCNGYESALEGYKDIFSKLEQPEYSEKAFGVLKGFYDKKHEEPNIEEEKDPRLDD